MQLWEIRNTVSSHFINLEPKIDKTVDNVPYYINSYQVTFCVEQESFIQLQLLTRPYKIMFHLPQKSQSLWLNPYQHGWVENLSPSSPENNLAVDEFKQNESEIEVFSPRSPVYETDIQNVSDNIFHSSSPDDNS